MLAGKRITGSASLVNETPVKGSMKDFNPGISMGNYGRDNQKFGQPTQSDYQKYLWLFGK